MVLDGRRYTTQYYAIVVDRSKNLARINGISHKIVDHKHQFHRKELGGSNLLSRKY